MSEALLAAIEADPGDVESYRVLADELQTAGDPRGVLIVMMIERATTRMPAKARMIDKEIARHFAAHQHALLGPLRPWTDDALYSPHWTWRHGFIHRLAPVGNVGDHNKLGLLSDVLAHPSGRLVGELALRVETYHQELVDVLATAPLSLRTLKLSIHSGTADLSRLWPRFPRLSKLALTFGEPGQALGTDDLPAVRELVLSFHALPASTVRLPSLETISMSDTRLSAGGWIRGSEPSHQRYLAFFANPPPLLTTLRIESAFTRELFDLVMASPLGAQLHDLDLTRGDLTDEAALAWAAKPPAHRLKVFRVRHNKLSRAGIAALAAVADRVVTKDEP